MSVSTLSQYAQIARAVLALVEWLRLAPEHRGFSVELDGSALRVALLDDRAVAVDFHGSTAAEALASAATAANFFAAIERGPL